MDYGTDRYLHKKFKKQLNTNIESRTNHAVEPPRINANVPINSTNVKESSVKSMLNFVKSSISSNLVYNYEINKKQDLDNNRNLFNEQSADISYVKVSVNPTESNTYLTSSIISNNQSYKESATQLSHDRKLPDSAGESSPPPESTSKPETSVLQDKANSAGGKYVCPYCNLVCSKPSVLQKHIRAHTNERPYPCVSCGFSFKTRSNLYKHCRSRTHANRVMGNKAQEISSDVEVSDGQNKPEAPLRPQNAEIILNASVIDTTSKSEIPEPPEPLAERTDIKSKPYKPRFHTTKFFYDNENSENSPTNNTISVSEKQSNSNCDLISLHITELIDKNNTIVNIPESHVFRRRSSESSTDTNEQMEMPRANDEPLNLTNKCRKRCLSEVTEPATQKSLIKELLLKNLYADSNMQCPHCKMIFQTVTEFELHKMRNCKGITKSGPRYSRSSSVNVASILTQNKNAFDNIPQLQNAVFPLKSPGPFLGKTRLVESDKTKSFSFDDNIQAANYSNDLLKTRYSTPPLTLPYDKVKKPPVKLFGGEVKISQTSGQAKSYKIDDSDPNCNYNEYSGSLSENRVVKSTLQSGGTVVQKNNQAYIKQESLRTSPDVIRVYENTTVSPTKRFMHENIDQARLNKEKNGVTTEDNHINIYKEYPNIMDFSQNAANLLAPNLKQLNLVIPKFSERRPYNQLFSTTPTSPKSKEIIKTQFQNFNNLHAEQPEVSDLKIDCADNSSNPVNLFVNGKVVRYVPGIPGPVIAETPPEQGTSVITIQKSRSQKPPNIVITPVETKPPSHKTFEEDRPNSKKLEMLEIKTELPSPNINNLQSPSTPKAGNAAIVTSADPPKKFARPNSLALKPSTTSLKQHHGLTPTMFNQILISPDTPRVAKKYNEHFLHGNYFSYLGLKSSTKPVYCTLNKTQPFYVHHFKKLSMYSEWRQQDNKSDRLYISAYDSSQKSHKYSIAGKYSADYIVHSSYKYSASEGTPKCDEPKSNSVLGGYESNEEYTYIRGRGRGRYVCDQCGIRCKKPSMLKKHIRTHSNDRPYTCNHCNFSFKTKGNLTKHMKSKAHTKNYAAISSSSSAQQSGTQSSDSDTEDSGMDSSDDSCSTRQQEHEAAYGLLSLSQKSTSTTLNINTSEINTVVSPLPGVKSSDVCYTTSSSFVNAEQLVQVSKTNYAKNKILDEQRAVHLNHLKLSKSMNSSINSVEEPNKRLNQYLGIGNTNQSLTYPYKTINAADDQSDEEIIENEVPNIKIIDSDKGAERKNIIQFNVIKKYSNLASTTTSSNKVPGEILKDKLVYNNNTQEKAFPVVKPREKIDDSTFYRKRKTSQSDAVVSKLKKNDSEVMDLSISQIIENSNAVLNENASETEAARNYYNSRKNDEQIKAKNSFNEVKYVQQSNYSKSDYMEHAEPENSRININYIIQESHINNTGNLKSVSKPEYDNSAMETLAEIATKQEKLEKNSVAKNVATEFLKLATKNEFPKGEEKGYINNNKEMNDLVGKAEENKSCTICSKSFSKPSQLRLHMNIHYLERPFRCESCSVSFRTKGHLQKHERSASHHNKLSSSPALSSSEPRPFKCIDCNIAFRIHGHLAKHLRSKMHIMKLECLAKIPFGLYAELERSNSLLTEINTADGDQCLDSLKTLAKKVFVNDPNKLNQVDDRSLDKTDVDTDS